MAKRPPGTGSMGVSPPGFTHVWRIRKYLPERFGRPCRIIAAGRGPGPRNILIEFADGAKIVTPRWNVRRL
jgi:hypothetical protein